MFFFTGCTVLSHNEVYVIASVLVLENKE